jgi:hypothetical protein
MDSETLAKEAIAHATTHSLNLNLFTVEKLAQAYIARWLYVQDETVLATAAVTACAAMGRITRHYC